MKRSWLLFLLTLLVSCDNTKRLGAGFTIPAPQINPTKDQAERRKRSETFCAKHAIPIYSNPHSLFLDPEDEITIRSQDSVVDRVLAIWYAGYKSEGVDKATLAKMDLKYGIMPKLSPSEKAYTISKSPTNQQNLNAGWRYEDMHIMLWALGYIDSLSYPDKQCNVVNDIKIIQSMTADNFRKKARLRTKKEIIDQADLILRIDWACVDARVEKRPIPAKLDTGVVTERHRALNWLIHFLNEEWDDVTTDT
jgi:hypothetical protein